jgi:hypothetical protein
MKWLIFFFLYIPLSVAAISIDGIELKDDKEIKGINVSNGKRDDTRIFRGYTLKEYTGTMESIKNSVVNFEDKCNNEFKSKRKFLDKKKDCKYFNKNIVESIIVKNHNYRGTKENNETERWVVSRIIYNRGDFNQYDLMIFLEYKNKLNEKVFEIKQTMLSDEEAKKYLDSPSKRESAFKDLKATYRLTEKPNQKILFEYEYISKTDHWFLNKDMMVGQIYDSMATGISDLLVSIEQGSKYYSQNAVK